MYIFYSDILMSKKRIMKIIIFQDDEWDSSEVKQNLVTSVPPQKPRPKKQRSDSRPSETSKPKKTSAKSEAVDARKKQALQHKLESLMSRHKDLLKKDILKKRAQLEKELQVEIHVRFLAAWRI